MSRRVRKPHTKTRIRQLIEGFKGAGLPEPLIRYMPDGTLVAIPRDAVDVAASAPSSDWSDLGA